MQLFPFNRGSSSLFGSLFGLEPFIEQLRIFNQNFAILNGTAVQALTLPAEVDRSLNERTSQLETATRTVLEQANQMSLDRIEQVSNVMGDRIGQANGVLTETISQVQTVGHGLLNQVNGTIENLVPTLVESIKLVAVQEIGGQLGSVLDEVISYIRSNQGNLNFGEKQAALISVNERLQKAKSAYESEREKTAETRKELVAAVESASQALLSANIHVFGKPLRKEGKNDDKPIPLRIKKEVVERTETKTIEDQFNEQRDLLTQNLRRIILVETVYRYAIGTTKVPDSIKELYKEGSEVDFEQKFFEELKKDLAKGSNKVSCFYRPFLRLRCYVTYLSVSFIVSGLIKYIGKFGIEAIEGAIKEAQKTNNAAKLHKHLFTFLTVYFNGVSAQYEKLENKDLKSVFDVEIGELFAESDVFRGGRSRDDLHNALIDIIMENTELFYPIKIALASILKEQKIIGWLLEISQKALQDEEGFNPSMDKLISDLLQELIDALQTPGEVVAAPEVSSEKQRTMEGFFQALFNTTPLMRIHTKTELREHFKGGKKTDKLLREYVLYPAANGGLNKLALAVEALFQKEKLEQIAINSLVSLNQGLVSTDSAKTPEKQALQAEVKQKQSALLDIVIEDSVEGIALLNPDKERDVANEKITKLKKLIADFVESFEGNHTTAVWNKFILDLNNFKKELDADGRINGSIKGEIKKYIDENLARSLQTINDPNKPIENFSKEEIEKTLQEVGKALTEMHHIIAYDPTGGVITGFVKELLKDLVKNLLHEQVGCLETLIKRKYTLEYALQTGVFRPALGDIIG